MRCLDSSSLKKISHNVSLVQTLPTIVRHNVSLDHRSALPPWQNSPLHNGRDSLNQATTMLSLTQRSKVERVFTKLHNVRSKLRSGEFDPDYTVFSLD